ncbi:MAG: PDZ domain-containing protein [Niabella sp.]
MSRNKILLLVAAFIPAMLFAQQKERDNEAERIIITKKGTDNEKMNIVVDGDHITVNGKPVGKDEDGNITVTREKIKDLDNFSWTPENGFNQPAMNRQIRITRSPNKAMLGVTTEKDENGVKIVSVNNESAAEKAGLKEGDLITGVDNKQITAPDELSQSLKDKKPGDKATITYIRDGKKGTVVAELTKWSAPEVMTFNNSGNGTGNSFAAPDIDMDQIMKSIPRNWGNYDNNYNNNFQFHSFSNNSGPKLGIQIQEVDKGAGVKVIEVEEGSDAAKAGIKEGDIIKEAGGVAIKGADDMISQVKKRKAGSSLKLKIDRNGRSQNIDVEFSKKLKSANL